MDKVINFLSILESEFPSDRLTYQKAIATFHPESGDEAARCVKLANRYQQPLFVTGFGNNIDPLGEPFTGMISIRTDRLNTLEEVAPEDFYVRVGAGYPVREIGRRLIEHQLFFPHADLPYTGSVGGGIAINLTADLGGHDLPIRRFLIMAEIVTGAGEIIKPGSTCFKSVSGYDVVKIFAPSWGLLGIIISAVFRVMPRSAAEEYLDMKQKAIDRTHFLAGLDERNQDVDAVYCRKIKNKFDPGHVLPIV